MLCQALRWPGRLAAISGASLGLAPSGFYGHDDRWPQTSVQDRYDPRKARESHENHGGSPNQNCQRPRATASAIAALGSTDLLYLAGGGIIGHPSGPAAGVRSLREAWQAAEEGVPLPRYAESHPALREALTAFAK